MIFLPSLEQRAFVRPSLESCCVCRGIRKEFRAKDAVVCEVGNEGPGPIWVLRPLDFGRLAGGLRGRVRN
jgi:hypothetical protein